MAPSLGLADNAKPCVLRRRFPASATRRGFAAHPRDGFRRRSAESGLEFLNQCVVCPDVASGGATIDGTLRDANDRPLPAGPAPARLSTEATTVVTPARANGQMGESADSNAPGRRSGGAGQASRAAGLDASTGRIGSQRPSGRRDASSVGWGATASTSNKCFTGRSNGEAQQHALRLPTGVATDDGATGPDSR
jgi:hypothetical protein